MKIVSYKVGQAIKKAGYPQEYSIGDSWCYENGQYPDESECENPPVSGWVLLPYYLDVWLWLWQEKKMRLSVEYTRATETEYESWCTLNQEHLRNLPVSNGNPEAAIIAAIEYLADNDLIK